ncbi:hypothetical protein [Breoghania sp. L-A4]|uniref:hypothetical protein n=1 Tax=Breoghania sp. L-A4 TaxID=2304600 RepID=UPI0013C37738|nr:hypothetical protein [Breoghania sp. L-A4]
MSPISDAGYTPAAVDIRDALDGILASDNFARSPKISRLLSYLVDKQIEGDAESLKEVAIATSVFNQQQGFNPRTNPIVRVNASRLRNLLRLYYADPGVDCDVRITLPDVGYAPIFAKAPPQEETKGELTEEDHGAGQPQPAAAGSAAVRNSAEPDAPGANEARPRNAGWRERSTRIGKVLGMPSSVAFVVANLIIACVFAVLLNRAGTTQGDYLISVPNTLEEAIPPSSLIMLCSQESEPAARYPVRIGERTVFCRPLKLRQTLLSVDPA